IQPALEQADQDLARIAPAAGRFLVDAAERLLGDVAVIAFQLLLGAQLQAEIRHLALAALAMLARSVGADIERALGPAPDIFAKTAVDLVLLAVALRHRVSFLLHDPRARKP